MKLLFNLLALAGVVSASLPIYGVPSKKNPVQKIESIKADSPLGQKLMSKARRVEENNNNNDNGEIDFTWVANFAIKFQGCHHVSQWNDEADGEEDVRIATKRLIRFRLCPEEMCTAESAGGCSADYGDYIIDMNTFLEVYYNAVEEYNQWRCEYTAQYKCGCNNENGNQDDGFDEEICEYDCYVANGIEDICAEKNPYADDEAQDEERFDLAEYVDCQQVDFEQQNNNNNNNGGRRLEEGQNNNNNQQEEEEVQYFVGPYCAEQGGAIYLGLFSDETCTTFADEDGGAYTYRMLAGESLPYSSQSVITKDCISCHEPEDFNNDGNDAQDADEVIEFCEQIYTMSGKCEEGLETTGYVYEANNNACNYIAGIKVVRKDGIITQVGSAANKTASIFIGIFVVAFVLLAAYVYYLKTKLDRASINLAE